jgi:hypothetical protein
MKRILLTATVLAAIVGGNFALAQSPAPSADDRAAHRPTVAKAPKGAASGEKAGAGQSGMGNGMMGGGNDMGNGMMSGGNGMMGNGVMGGGNGMMGGGMCGMMMGAANTKIDVKKIDKGVTITVTSSDAAAVARLQKMAEAMRLMHEAMTQ